MQKVPFKLLRFASKRQMFRGKEKKKEKEEIVSDDKSFHRNLYSNGRTN